LEVRLKQTLFSNRIPKDFFVTKGKGESDITVHAGSYHLALKDADIEMHNITRYSSILPGIARKIRKPKNRVHGSVMEVIEAASTAQKGKRATAGIIYGWLYDKKTKQKYGGLVCEHYGSVSEEEIRRRLKASLNELYTNGYSKKFHLRGIEMNTESFVPKKKYGTALVALCFVNYVYPEL
jgi:arginine decarboxylase